MSQRAADLFGWMPTVDETEPRHCDGDCPPWWFPLCLHVPADGCTPMTVMWLHRWHLSHAGVPDAPSLEGGLLQ